MSVSTQRSPRRRLANTATLLGLALALILGTSTHASPLATTVLQHSLLAGPNQHNPEPQRTPSTPVGTIPGTVRVDERGAARISLPIQVPPAARGIQPGLSLEYDSQRSDGALGVGWSLAGQSAISRCAHTLADDGEVAPVRMTDDDSLCLDGERLMLIEGTPFEVGAIYRPKRDDFSRVQIVASGQTTAHGCHGGYGFEVRRRDGTIATYGCSRDATITTHLGARTWVLARVRDRFGNAIDYRYTYETAGAEGGGQADVDHYLSTVEYGAHIDLHAATRHVRLEWEPRPDPSTGYFLGAPQRQSKRLRRVSTFAAGELVHRYELDYDAPSITGRSLLHAVRHCDAQGVCKPDTTFTWERGELAVGPLAEGGNFSGLAHWPYMDQDGDPSVGTPLVLDQTVLDANGDGHTDMLLAVGDNDEIQPLGRGWELWTSQPFAQTFPGAICGTSKPNFAGCAAAGGYVVHEAPRTGSLAGGKVGDLGPATPSMFALDYDGDGRDDAIALGPNNIAVPGAPPGGTRFYIVRSQADGGVKQFEFDPKAKYIWWFTAADQTGDGLGDLLFCGGDLQDNHFGQAELGTGSWQFIPNVPGVGFEAANRIDTGLACSSFDKFLHLDHDGDGMSSLLIVPTWDTGTKAIIRSQDWSNYHALRLDPLAGWAATLEDTGLPPDLAQRWRPSIAGNFNLAFALEDFPRSQQGFGLDKVIDVNGDGLDDVLRYELDIGDTAAQLGHMMETIVSAAPSKPEWGGVRVWINTGAGFVDGGWLMQADKPGDFFFRRFLAAGVLDYDGDGRLDYLTPVDDPNSHSWSWSIWTSNGDGTFVERPQVFEAPFDDMTLSARTMGAFDLDGDGLHDPGVFHPPGWTLWQHAGAVPDKIVGVEDGLGARSEFHYRSLTDIEAPEGFFQIDPDACVYPERCERSPRIVVERHLLDSGITGQPREFEHRYGLARSDRTGARGLGFERHEVIEWADVTGQRQPIYRQTTYYGTYYGLGYDEALRDFPFAGLPRLVIEDQRDPATGRHRIIVDGNTYDHVQTTPQTYFPYVAQRVARVYELDGCADTFCNTFLEVDESSMVTGTVETIFEIDEYANPLIWSSSADTGTSTLSYHHEAEYHNDPGSWLLGLPIYDRVTFLQSQVAQRDRESKATYDPNTGALQARITEPGAPELYLHESFSYDEHGNVIQRTAVDGGGVSRTSTLGYDEHGVFPATSINALGHKATMRWDPGLGVPIEARDINDLRTVADYDGLGHLTGVRSFAGVLPRGDETTVSYAALVSAGDGPVMQIRAETDGHGRVTSEFDRLGRVVTERELGLDDVERFVAIDYDARGRVRASSLPTPLGQAPLGWELLDYDFADRLILRTLPDGTSESWNHQGLELEHVDIGGTVSRLRHDQAARLVESIRGLGTPDEERLCFDYGAFELLEHARPDCIGRQSHVQQIGNGEAPATIKTFHYDDLGQLIASHDPSEGSRSFFYNGHGELDGYVDGNGNEVSYTRDALGRVIERHDADGLTTWVWDLTRPGELAASKSPTGHTEQIEYDIFGRVSLLSKIIDGESFDLSFEYDGFDRLAEIHYPTADETPAFWVRNVYAKNGQLRAVHDGPGGGQLWTVDALDAQGRITAERFGQHLVTERDYDPLRGFVRSIRSFSTLGGALQDLDYQWNHDGTLHRRRDLIHQQLEAMDYDALHRVIGVHTQKAQTVHDRHFAYDSLGNLVYATDRGQYDYDHNGRLVLADGNSFEWDHNGNLIARVGQSPATLSYTAFDKIAELETESGTTVFEYDAAGDRVYRYAEADGRETVYVTDLYQRHRDEDAGETEHHYYVPGLERTVASVVDKVGVLAAERSIHYIHVDHLGSTDVVSDASGTIEQRMSYDAWGKRRDPSNWTLPDEFAELGPVNLGYTGHEAQEDGGLINMGGRMYDPHLGRMASADPYVVDPTSTQGWNRYAYVLNRPLALIDPSGFSPAPTTVYEFEPYEVYSEVPASSAPLANPAPLTSSNPPASSNTVRNDGNPSPRAESKANQTPGDNGPTVAKGSLGDGLSSGSASLNPVARGVSAMHETRPLSPYREQVRDQFDDANTARMAYRMNNPGSHVEVSLALTLIFLGGDLEWVGVLAKKSLQAAGRVAVRRGSREIGEAAAKSTAKVPGANATPKPKPKKASGGAEPVRVGQEGEDAVRAVYDIGPKMKIEVQGKGRIPDGLTSKVLSEVKNVKSQSFSRQLKDFLQHAKDNGLEVHLYVREGAQLSRPLQGAISEGLIQLRYIP